QCIRPSLRPPPPRSALFPYTTLFRSHLGALVRWRDGPRITFVRARGAVGVHRDDQRVAECASFAQVADMPRMDEIEDAIREDDRSEEHTSELQSPDHIVCRLLLEKKK